MCGGGGDRSRRNYIFVVLFLFSFLFFYTLKAYTSGLLPEILLLKVLI